MKRLLLVHAAGDWVLGTADPIPADYDVVMQMSNKFIPRGQVQNLSKKCLISGTYTVTYTERVVRPFTDLELWTDEQGNPLWWGPTHVKPYTTDPIVCTFTVAPPSP